MSRTGKRFIVAAALAATIFGFAMMRNQQRAQLAAAPKISAAFTQPVLVKNSPTNLRFFDVSWNDNATQRYYLADRNNNAIDVVDSATDTFLGFIGKGHYTGARPCPGEPKEMRLSAG